MSGSVGKAVRYAFIWGLFFLTCLSLGYPTLNRYQPGPPQLSDSPYYVEMVERDFRDLEPSYWHFRVLVPLVAKPFYWMGRGRIGTWNPAYFGLLIANALFIASAALVFVRIGIETAGDARFGFLVGLLFLSHFNVANLYLAGLVDSAEVFLLVVLVWALLNRWWLVLPALGVVGGLAKESYVVFSTVFAGSWFLVSDWRRWFRPRPLVGIGAMAGLGLVTISLLRVYLAPDWGQPWNLGKQFLQFGMDVPAGIASLVFSRAFVYTFAWILPLGLLGIRHVPRPWILASAVTFAVMVVIAVLAGSGPNVGRPLFAAAGPMLIFGSAAFVWDVLRSLGRDAGPR